jgi:tetratricopeptide (TPR) repeat protein
VQVSSGEISTCATCGGSLEETANGELGCMVCLLRVGLTGDDEPTDGSIAATDEHFGIYVIDRRDDGSLCELGRGATGVTYRATDTSLQRKVALKIINMELGARSSDARERFMRGARAAASLRHENVATIYQFGIREDTGQCYYAMELIEGETLEERVRRTGPLDASIVITIGQQVADALADAEKRGLVHRDLKPANLMLADSDQGMRVKIIDFGLAKAIAAQNDPMSLTQGGFVGTPAFASPEQFGNAPLDIRSDIYSLGVTFWFALTGKTPFKGRSVDEIRNTQSSNNLPMEQLKAACVPSSLRSLLKSMLAFEPAARPGTGDLIAQLRRWHSPAMRRITIGAAAALVVIALAFFLLRSSQTALPPQGRKMSVNGTGTSNSQAREAYAKGRSLFSRREIPTIRQAIEYFERAIALDPNYARAYAGLADAYPLIAMNDPLIARSEDYAKARTAANKAIELDATLAEPHAALGLIAMNYEWDWPTAEREFKRAIELNPTYSTAHHWYAEYLITQGRSDESIAEIQRAHELEPHSSIIMCDKGKIFFYSRRYDEAIEVLRKTIESDPDFLAPHVWLGQAYHETGVYDKAVLEFRASERPDKLDAGSSSARFPYMTAMIGRTLAKAGRKAEAEKIFGDLQQLRKRHELEPIILIPIYLALGEKDEVFDLLEKEYDVRSTGLTSLKVNPLYDSLRSDPRFTELMRRVHLPLGLTGPERRAINPSGTSNPQAQQAYLKGRSLWAKREYQTHKEAITCFEKAIALDPNYAEAYAGLADTYPLLANDDPLIARSEDYAKAKAAANKAMELDATLSEPHAALGLIAMNYEWDWATAEKEYKRAIELNPNNPTAHHWYAEYLITQGGSDESLAEIKRAHELDPGSTMIMNDTGKILLYSRRYDEAIGVLRKTLEMDSNFLQPHAWLAQVYYEKGLYDKAISEFKAGAVRDVVAGFDHNPWTPAMVGRTLAKAGRKEEAQKYFHELQQIRKRREVEPQFLIAMYLALGEKDQVFDLLEKEYEVRSTGLTSLKVNPYYDSVRSDPRFTELMRRIGLAPPDSSTSRSAAPEKSVLVLPFANLSRNSDSAYLAEGLRDQIQTRLVKLADLRIISAGPADASQVNTAELYRRASEAGVTRILQGSVQAEGEVFRAMIQLVEVKSGSNLWAETYDRKMSDLLQVEKDVAEDVASSLAVRLTDREKQAMNAKTTSNAEAHEAYLKGRYFWNTRSWKGYEQSRQYFSRAIALDPNYAQAYVGLADAFQFLAGEAGKNPRESYDQAKAANRKALELDPSLAEAHASLGLIAMNYDWDWAAAEREYRRAIELNPSYAMVRDWYSEYLIAVGRPEESLQEMRKARELGPFSLVFKTDLGKMLFFARRYDEAIENLNEILKTDPNGEGAHFWLGWVYAAQKKYDQALAEFERLDRDSRGGGSLGGQGYVYGIMGKRQQAEQMLTAVTEHSPTDPQPRCWIHIALGDKDKAFACLEEEFKLHATGLISLKTAPHYDSLRSDPRFLDLLRRVHLTP